MSQLAGLSKRHHIRMAILAVPAEAAQEVTNALVDAGILGILNFSPNVLSVPEEVMINNVNLAIELENLSYFIQG
jgi:redox-sensing transcriptional repressor